MKNETDYLMAEIYSRDNTISLLRAYVKQQNEVLAVIREQLEETVKLLNMNRGIINER